MRVIAATQDETEFERMVEWCSSQGARRAVTFGRKSDLLLVQLQRPSGDPLLVRFAVEVADEKSWSVWVLD